MNSLGIQRLLLCVILAAALCEHPRLRAVPTSGSEGQSCRCLVDADDFKVEHGRLEVFLGSQPMTLASDSLCHGANSDGPYLTFDSPQRTVTHMRGPPCSGIS